MFKERDRKTKNEFCAMSFTFFVLRENFAGAKF